MAKNEIIEQKKISEELKRKADDLIERMSKISLKDRHTLDNYVEIDELRSEIREYVNKDFNNRCNELIDQARGNPKKATEEIILGCQTKLTLQFDSESYSYLRKLDELLTKE